MNEQEKAQEIYDKTVGEVPQSLKLYMPVKNIHEIVIKIAVSKVDLVINSLETTTGHLTLNRNDQLEIGSDFKFWNGVKNKLVNFKFI